ncbi:putative L,D-transpeptidase YnhG precursor [Piscirickettsia salmonis]|uniref:L,D-transpeptidase family protein n=1 Tax=Piscirickettsia salmonis TaxID=1238 RepID=UPI0012BAFA6F|nr:L,D-transpeptidase family protein [Piscirickettsia salmonis]QGP54374.1 putative L,D-transpeptidase YnhG precursor [Piscirickettsia salmonis]QGP59735.1 putative L,D-transpeptidase YnhG precursor [Piscirickettsia salmonis]QGP64432.1 putative L,D-transpeptidase YnhG precursor [Piscirickettsia salmonis]
MKDKPSLLFILLLLYSSFTIYSVYALQLPLPKNNESVIGHSLQVTAQKNDNFMHLARLYSSGFHELMEANADISPWHPLNGENVLIPTEFILPDAPRDGIIINLAELRLYYFDHHSKRLFTYPVGVGKRGWMTPVGKRMISHKLHKPYWHVPDSIREHYAKQGKYLAKSVAPGPKNPLGKHAMRLSHSSYLIHGTNKIMGISRRTSSGCISLFPEDIENLFNIVKINTPVYIVNQAYKIGQKDNQLFLEIHKPLYEFKATQNKLNQQVIYALLKYNQSQQYQLNWDKITKAINEQRGIPTLISN